MNYSEKLKDPRWQKKRLEIFERDKFTCQACFDNTSTLHVHHRIYINGKEPWDYSDLNFITLCEDCHQYETENIGNAINNLVRIMKVHFLSHHIKNITEALRKYEHTHVDEICASAIAYFLSDPGRCRFMVDKFLGSLGHQEKEEKIEKVIEAENRPLRSLKEIRESVSPIQ